MTYSVTIDYLVHTLLKQLTISETWDWLNMPVSRCFPKWPEDNEPVSPHSTLLEMWSLIPSTSLRSHIIRIASNNPKELL